LTKFGGGEGGNKTLVTMWQKNSKFEIEKRAWKTTVRMVFFHCSGKIEVTWVSYFDICIYDDMCNSKLFVRIWFFLFVSGKLERFEKLEIFVIMVFFFVQC